MALKSLDRDLNYKPQIAITSATIEDTKAVSTILAQSFYNFPEYAHWIYPFLRLTINEDLRYRLRSASPSYGCLVAKARKSGEGDTPEEVVGTIEIALRSSLWPHSDRYPYISNLAVASESRRLGVGTQLLQACEQMALDWGYQEIRLHVLDRNEPAKQLYCSNGYQISQIESNWGGFWFDCSPRLLLKKAIRRS